MAAAAHVLAAVALGACDYFVERDAVSCEATARAGGGITMFDAELCRVKAIELGQTYPQQMNVDVEVPTTDWPPGCYVYLQNNAMPTLNDRLFDPSMPTCTTEDTPTGCQGACNMNNGPPLVTCICAAPDCFTPPPTLAPPTDVPPTPLPPTPAPPTDVPPTLPPPTVAPPTPVPTTASPPTPAPPTVAPPTPIPETPAPPTPLPLTPAPPTQAPPTSIPTTDVPLRPTPAPAAPPTTSPQTPAPQTQAPAVPATPLPTTPQPTGVPAAPTPVPTNLNVSEDFPLPKDESVIPAGERLGRGVAAGSAIASLVTPGASAATGAAIALFAFDGRCSEKASDDIPVAHHPLQLLGFTRLFGSAHAAVIAGNVMIVGAIWLGGWVVVAILKAASRCCPVEALTTKTLLEAQGLLRFPSAVLFVYTFLFQGTAVAGMNVLLHNAEPIGLGIKIVVGVVLFLMFLLPFNVQKNIVMSVPQLGFYQKATNNGDRPGLCCITGVQLQFIIGPGEWVSRHRNHHWVARYQACLRRFKQENAADQIQDYLLMTALALTKVPSPSSWVTCGHTKLAAAIIVLWFGAFKRSRKMYVRPRDNYLIPTQLLWMGIGLICMAVGFYSEDPNHLCFRAAGLISQAVYGLLMLQCVLDAFTEIFVVFRRGRIQLEVWGRIEAEEKEKEQCGTPTGREDDEGCDNTTLICGDSTVRRSGDASDEEMTLRRPNGGGGCDEVESDFTGASPVTREPSSTTGYKSIGRRISHGQLLHVSGWRRNSGYGSSVGGTSSHTRGNSPEGGAGGGGELGASTSGGPAPPPRALPASNAANKAGGSGSGSAPVPPPKLVALGASVSLKESTVQQAEVLTPMTPTLDDMGGSPGPSTAGDLPSPPPPPALAPSSPEREGARHPPSWSVSPAVGISRKTSGRRGTPVGEGGSPPPSRRRRQLTVSSARGDTADATPPELPLSRIQSLPPESPIDALRKTSRLSNSPPSTVVRSPVEPGAPKPPLTRRTSSGFGTRARGTSLAGPAERPARTARGKINGNGSILS